MPSGGHVISTISPVGAGRATSATSPGGGHVSQTNGVAGVADIDPVADFDAGDATAAFAPPPSSLAAEPCDAHAVSPASNTTDAATLRRIPLVASSSVASAREAGPRARDRSNALDERAVT